MVVPLKVTTKESVLQSPYKVLTSASSGWYNWWLVRDTYEEVVPRLQDPLGVLIWSNMWSFGGLYLVARISTIENQIAKNWINIQSTYQCCWHKRVPRTSSSKQATYTKHKGHKRMQALLIFFCAALFYALAFFFLSFSIQKCHKSKRQLHTITKLLSVNYRFATQNYTGCLTNLETSNTKTYNTKVVDPPFLFLYNIWKVSFG